MPGKQKEGRVALSLRPGTDADSPPKSRSARRERRGSAPMPGANTKAGRGREENNDKGKKSLLFSCFYGIASATIRDDARQFSLFGQN